MTEDEVKTKRCCGPDGCGELRPLADATEEMKERGLGAYYGRFCIGSACMAFRWEPFCKPHGYCGLAGAP